MGCAIFPRGVDSLCDALFAYLTASQLSHPNGPKWLRAGKSPEDGLSVQLPYGGWTSTVTLSLLTSLQVHYPTRKARIGIKPGLSREFAQRWVGCAIFPRGVDSLCDALFAYLTASQLSHPNGPKWLRAGKSPEDGLSVQLPYGGWTSTVTLSLLTSLQVHYPTRKARIGIKPGIRPKMGGLCNFSTGGGLSL